MINVLVLGFSSILPLQGRLERRRKIGTKNYGFALAMLRLPRHQTTKR
jgi:hypothetical protein